jgi:hypothetical protein
MVYKNFMGKCLCLPSPFECSVWFTQQARLWTCGRGDMSTPSFDSHLNPISTRGGRLCPPYIGVHTKFWKPQARLHKFELKLVLSQHFVMNKYIINCVLIYQLMIKFQITIYLHYQMQDTHNYYLNFNSS